MSQGSGLQQQVEGGTQEAMLLNLRVEPVDERAVTETSLGGGKLILLVAGSGDAPLLCGASSCGA